MPRAPLHALIWSQDHNSYILHNQDQSVQHIEPGNEASWLQGISSFAFHGLSGSLNVYLESRSPGGLYWYAYHSSRGRTRKRYLGRTESISLARLENTARALVHDFEIAQTPKPEIALLSTKLTPPRLPSVLVERGRLLSALNDALTTPLTLVCAPAGFGKTTLLSTWARQKRAQVAWLSLDELDTSATRFWVSLIAALRRSGNYPPDLGDSTMAFLQSPQTLPLSSCLSALLQELESHEENVAPLVLIVDDYQRIDDPIIHQSLTFFLEHLPVHLHLILASRVDPDLPLSRLRVRGHLTEIRAEKLRFEEDEASQYLGQHLSPALSSEEVHKLVGRTEGWIAGLHLVVLAMQKCEDRTTYLETLTGSQRYLLDYMQEDILAHLSSQVRDFLLQSAILSHLDASVCQAVTTTATRVASQQMLAFLERMNLFLIPLDEERHKYRLHELFREALLSILHTTQPELVPILHQRAASFYEAEGQWTEAITHRFKGRDFSAAAHLMERTVEQFWVRGEAEAMTHWALALPQSVVQEHASLLLTTALYHLATGMTTPQVQRERRHAEVQQLMTRVETALQQDIHPISPVERDLIQRRLRLLHLYLILNEVGASADFERLYSVQQEIQEALDGEEETIWQIAPLWASFMLHSIIWQAGARLLPQLFSARERLPRTANLFTVIKIRQWLAMTAVEAGQLHLATQESQAVLNLIEQITGYASLKGYFQIVLAQVFYQWNRIEDVRSLLHTVIQAATPWQHLDLLGRGYTGLLQVALATGDGALAEVSLHKMEELVQREHFETYPSMLPALRAHYWLMNGQIEAASGWATNIILIDGPWEKGTYDAFPIIVRVYFAQRNFREALALLERWSVHLDRPTNIRITITYLAQLLVALYQIGKLEQAYKIATRLFALTEPEGYLRVYLDEGEPMREALLALLTSHSQQGNKVYIAKLLAAFEDEAQHSATGSPLQQVAYSLSPRDTFLTRREQEVLHLLATGASNQDIAQALVISLPTVKKHVSNLLSKLGATSRVQIIAQAHTRSLFPIDSSQ